MSGESRSHLHTSAQRRFVRIFLLASVVTLLLAIPLVVRPGLRLEVAHRLELVPGSDIEQISAGSDGLDLIVAPIEIERPNNRPQYRFRAVYLAREVAEGIELTSIDTGARTIVPLQTYDFISADPGARNILFQDRRDPSAIQGALVDVATGVVTTLPADTPYPDLPGQWKEPVWAQTMGTCDGISPNATYIACFQNPELASYLAGIGSFRFASTVMSNARPPSIVARGSVRLSVGPVTIAGSISRMSMVSGERRSRKRCFRRASSGTDARDQWIPSVA